MAELARFGDHVDVLTGHPFKSAGYDKGKGGVRLLRGDNIGQGRIRWEGAKRWPLSESTDYQRYQLRPGDVVLAMDRPWIDAGLKWAELRTNDVPSLLVQRVACLRARSDLDQGFLPYLVCGKQFTDYVVSVQTGTAVPHISSRQIEEFEFLLPDLNTQRAIAAVLGALDDKIAINDRIASTCHSMAQAYAVCARAIAQARQPSFLGELIDLRYGKALPESLRKPGGVPVYGSGGVIGEHDSPAVVGPGVIIGRKGTVGSVHWSQHSFFPIDTTYYVELRRPEIPMEFVYFILRSLGLGKMNSDSAVPGLNRANALSLPVKIPAKAYLGQFREKTQPLFALRYALSTETRALAQLRDTLLPRLMSGELRVRDAEKAVEEAL